jgi:hypothetical protein
VIAALALLSPLYPRRHAQQDQPGRVPLEDGGPKRQHPNCLAVVNRTSDETNSVPAVSIPPLARIVVRPENDHHERPHDQRQPARSVVLVEFARSVKPNSPPCLKLVPERDHRLRDDANRAQDLQGLAPASSKKHGTSRDSPTR